MHLRLVKAGSDTRQLDEIVNAFIPPMKRVCPHLAETALREMVQRMALQQLADEQRRRRVPARHGANGPTRPDRAFRVLRAC